MKPVLKRSVLFLMLLCVAGSILTLASPLFNSNAVLIADLNSNGVFNRNRLSITPDSTRLLFVDIHKDQKEFSCYDFPLSSNNFRIIKPSDLTDEIVSIDYISSLSDSQTAICWGQGNRLWRISIVDGSIQNAFSFPSGINTVSVATDSPEIAVVHTDFQKCCVLKPDGQLLSTINIPLKEAFDGSIALSPRGNLLLTFHKKTSTARLWNARSGTLISHLVCPDFPFFRIEFAPDEKSILVSNGNSRISRFDLPDFREVFTHKVPQYVTSFCHIGQNGSFAVASDAGLLDFFNRKEPSLFLTRRAFFYRSLKLIPGISGLFVQAQMEKESLQLQKLFESGISAGFIFPECL